MNQTYSGIDEEFGHGPNHCAGNGYRFDAGCRYRSGTADGADHRGNSGLTSTASFGIRCRPHSYGAYGCPNSDHAQRTALTELIFVFDRISISVAWR
jgi:hypothetical protein